MNVLVPALRLGSSSRLLSVADAVIQSYGGQGRVLSVVEVPEERSLSEGALVVRSRRRLLRRVARLPGGADFRAEVRTAHSVEQGIRDAVSETETDLLLLTWRPPRRPVSAIGTVERLVASPPCDIATVKEGVSQEVRSVLVPARGGPHAQLAL